MTPAKKEEYAPAKDGLPARRNGAWARDKLSFFDEFLPPALQVTKTKQQRHYVDLFAGPGINIDDDGEEFDGGAIRALKARAQADPSIGFTNAWLVNKAKKAHSALRTRVAIRCGDGSCAVDDRAIEYMNEDANKVTHAIMRKIHPKAYAFVFADIESPNQLPYETVRALKMHSHTSVDFCVLFPSDMALWRLLPFPREKLEPNVAALNAYFGTEGWLALWEARKTESQTPELYRRMQQLYEQQLRKLGWKHVVQIRHVKRVGEAGLYKIILATDHPVALKFGLWSVQQEQTRKGQPDLFSGDQ